MLTYPVGTLNPKTSDALFRMSINTALGIGTTFALPLPSGRTYDFLWNPGDGSALRHVTAYNDATATYDYGTPFSGQISIKGKCGGWSFNNGGDKLKVVSVDQFGDVAIDYLIGGFFGCTNLFNCAPLTGFLGTNLQLAFYNTPNLVITSDFFTGVGHSLATMQYCFLNSGITVFPNMSTLTGLTSIYGIFTNCLGLNGATIPENYLLYNINVTNYREAFANIRNLILPSVMFNLLALTSTCDFSSFMTISNIAYSHTGIIQDVWNYSPSGAHVNAFLNQTALTNYAAIPADWK